jgi:hypothetical protein
MYAGAIIDNYGNQVARIPCMLWRICSSQAVFKSATAICNSEGSQQGRSCSMPPNAYTKHHAMSPLNFDLPHMHDVSYARLIKPQSRPAVSCALRLFNCGSISVVSNPDSSARLRQPPCTHLDCHHKFSAPTCPQFFLGKLFIHLPCSGSPVQHVQTEMAAGACMPTHAAPAPTACGRPCTAVHIM